MMLVNCSLSLLTVIFGAELLNFASMHVPSIETRTSVKQHNSPVQSAEVLPTPSGCVTGNGSISSSSLVASADTGSMAGIRYVATSRFRVAPGSLLAFEVSS
jgi:hypothetical protein